MILIIKNKPMEERGWTAGKVVKTILMLLFSGIIGGIVYIVMTNNLLKQKNRLVNDHNNKIGRDNKNEDGKNDKKKMKHMTRKKKSQITAKRQPTLNQ